MSVSVNGVGTFGATPTPAGSAFPSGTVFSWTSSNVLIATVAQGSTGLICSVSGKVAGFFTLTFAATLPNNSIVQASAQVQVTS